MDRRTGELLDDVQAKRRVKEGSIDKADLVPLGFSIGGTSDDAQVITTLGPPPKDSPEREPGKKYRWLHNPSATKKKPGPRKKRPKKSKR